MSEFGPSAIRRNLRPIHSAAPYSCRSFCQCTQNQGDLYSLVVLMFLSFYWKALPSRVLWVLCDYLSEPASLYNYSEDELKPILARTCCHSSLTRGSRESSKARCSDCSALGMSSSLKKHSPRPAQAYQSCGYC